MSEQELELLEIYRSLDAKGKRQLRDFIAFLAQGSKGAE